MKTQIYAHRAFAGVNRFLTRSSIPALMTIYGVSIVSAVVAYVLMSSSGYAATLSTSTLSIMLATAIAVQLAFASRLPNLNRFLNSTIEIDASQAISESHGVLRGPLGRLADAMGLTVFGDSLLTRKAAEYMKIYALFLSLDAIWHFAFWFVLLESIFATSTVVGDLLSGAAAMLITVAVGLFELTALTFDRSSKLRSAIHSLLRTVVACSLALVIAPVLESFILRPAIDTWFRMERAQEQFAIELRHRQLTITPKYVERWQLRALELSTRASASPTVAPRDLLSDLRVLKEMRTGGVPLSPQLTPNDVTSIRTASGDVLFRTAATVSANDVALLHNAVLLLVLLMQLTPAILRLFMPYELQVYYNSSIQSDVGLDPVLSAMRSRSKAGAQITAPGRPGESDSVSAAVAS